MSTPCRLIALFLALWLPIISAAPVYATVSFDSNGAAAAQVSSINLAYPATVTQGNLLLICVANKYPSNGPSTPSGWTLIGQYEGGDNLGNSVDGGNVYMTAFYKIAAGTETGSQTVSVTSGNSMVGIMMQFAKTLTTFTGGVDYVFGKDEDGGTGWSITGASNPGLTNGDMIVACTAKNSDNQLSSVHAFSATSATFGAVTELYDSGTSFGDDTGMVISYAQVTGGPATSNWTYSFTVSAGGGTEGSTLLIRLRDISTSSCRMTLLGVC